MNVSIATLKNILIKTKNELDSFKFENLNLKKNSGKYNCFYPGFECSKEFTNKIELNSNINSTDIYIHIPYCSRKCTFCAYYSKTNLDDKTELINSIIKEIQSYKKYNYKIEHLEIGGGTPSLLEISDLKKILDECFKSFQKTKNSIIKIEVHPEIVQTKKFKIYLQKMSHLGIDEISLGIETFDENLLKKLNRGHNISDVKLLLKEAKKYFKRIRIDLIYGFDQQTIKDWIYSIQKALELEVNDISAYMFIKSSLSKHSSLDIKKLNLMELFFINTMIHLGWSPGGFMATEFKFIKEKRKIFNNVNNMKVIGIGPSAYSITDKYNAVNHWNNNMYIQSVKKNNTGIALINTFTKNENIINSILHNILFQANINNSFFIEKYDFDVLEHYKKEIHFLIQNKLAKFKNKDHLIITKKGILYNDQIASLFLPKNYYLKYFAFRKNTKHKLDNYKKEIINSPFGFNLNEKNLKF